MANTSGENKPAAKEAETKTLLDQIGTLTYPRAVEHFGKDNALSVMRQVAEIGGHGLFEDDHFKSPLFGGLIMPDPEKVAEPKEEEFAHLPDAKFHYQAAVEEHGKMRAAAADNRKKINALYKKFSKS